MSYVISIRIRKELKELMDRAGIDWSNEIRMFLEERVREVLKARLLEEVREFRRELNVMSPVGGDELVREDRESHG